MELKCFVLKTAHYCISVCRDGSYINRGFNDQDEIDTVRLAIAYGQNSLCAQHIVTIGPSLDLFKHIPHELVDKFDTLEAMSGNTTS